MLYMKRPSKTLKYHIHGTLYKNFSFYYSVFQIFKFTLSTRESIIKQHDYSQEIEEFQVHDIKKSNSQKKLARTILQINLIFFSSFSPHLIIFVAQLIGIGHYVPKYVSMVAMFLCHFSSAINAIYYGLR